MKSNTGKVKAYGLVRDKDGKPKIDDIHNIHPIIWTMLTQAEQLEIIKQRMEKN